MSAEQTLNFDGPGGAGPVAPAAPEAAPPKPVENGKRDPFDLGWAPKHNPWAVAVVVTLAAFMEILDTTIVNVALPHIAGSLSSSNDEATWALTSYLVANGIVLTISGWLGSLLGRKRYFLICLAMFTVCSFLCGIASSLPQLILFRLLQGFFGGGLQPNQQSIILDYFPPARRGAAFGLTAIATIVGPVLGPTLGGIITDSVSWRWIFFVNVPVGIAAVILVYILVEDPPWVKRQPRPIDGIGLGLIALGLGCLEVMMDRGEDADWFGSSFIVIMAMLSVTGLVGAAVWLSVAKKPIISLAIFKDKNFTGGCVMIGCVGAILYASSVIIPQYAQQVLGYTATWAGMILSPGGLIIIMLIPLVGRLMNVIQTRYIIAIGFFLLGLSFIYSSRLVLNITYLQLVMIRSSQTVGLAFLFVPISTITYSTLPRELNGDATSLFSMFRNVAGSIGIAGSTALIQQRSQVHQTYLSQWTSPFWQPFNDLVAKYQAALQGLGNSASAAHQMALGQVYQGFLKQVSVMAYSDVFKICSLVAFALVPLCFTLSPIKGGRGGGGGH
jgi:MFS transporter, DHA2 family, multidrug resistance protein